jgi:hypothetical protein
MKNEIDNLLKPVKKKLINFNDFCILFGSKDTINDNDTLNNNKEDNNFNEKQNIKKKNKEEFIGAILKKTTNKKFQKEKSKENKKTFEGEKEDDILHSIDKNFDNVPYYQLFK